MQIYTRLSSANMLAVELIFLKVERNSSKVGRFYTRSIYNTLLKSRIMAFICCHVIIPAAESCGAIARWHLQDCH